MGPFLGLDLILSTFKIRVISLDQIKGGRGILNLHGFNFHSCFILLFQAPTLENSPRTQVSRLARGPLRGSHSS